MEVKATEVTEVQVVHQTPLMPAITKVCINDEQALVTAEVPKVNIKANEFVNIQLPDYADPSSVRVSGVRADGTKVNLSGTFEDAEVPTEREYKNYAELAVALGKSEKSEKSDTRIELSPFKTTSYGGSVVKQYSDTDVLVFEYGQLVKVESARSILRHGLKLPQDGKIPLLKTTIPARIVKVTTSVDERVDLKITFTTSAWSVRFTTKFDINTKRPEKVAKFTQWASFGIKSINEKEYPIPKGLKVTLFGFDIGTTPTPSQRDDGLESCVTKDEKDELQAFSSAKGIEFVMPFEIKNNNNQCVVREGELSFREVLTSKDEKLVVGCEFKNNTTRSIFQSAATVQVDDGVEEPFKEFRGLRPNDTCTFAFAEGTVYGSVSQNTIEFTKQPVYDVEAKITCTAGSVIDPAMKMFGPGLRVVKNTRRGGQYIMFKCSAERLKKINLGTQYTLIKEDKPKKEEIKEDVEETVDTRESLIVPDATPVQDTPVPDTTQESLIVRDPPVQESVVVRDEPVDPVRDDVAAFVAGSDAEPEVKPTTE